MTNLQRKPRTRPERRRNHGSRARIPGDFFRATAQLYLELKPDVPRENLARRIARHLGAQGVEYHVRTIRRQILGIVTTVPPEVEDTMRRFAREDLGFGSDHALLDALACSAHRSLSRVATSLMDGLTPQHRSDEANAHPLRPMSISPATSGGASGVRVGHS